MRMPGPYSHFSVYLSAAGDPCSLPGAVVGLGTDALSRWSYDAVTRSCVQFVYFGRKGNANNFLTKADCSKTCAGMDVHLLHNMHFVINGIISTPQRIQYITC